MSDESSEGKGPRGGDGTRATVDDLRGGVKPTAPPSGIDHEDTVAPEESPLLAALLSAVIPGVGHARAGLRRRGMYWFGGWLVYVFVSAVLLFYGIGVLMVLALPVLHLGAAVDAYRQVSRWRDEEKPRIG